MTATRRVPEAELPLPSMEPLFCVDGVCARWKVFERNCSLLLFLGYRDAEAEVIFVCDRIYQLSSSAEK